MSVKQNLRARAINRILEHPKTLYAKIKGIHSNHAYTCLKVQELIGNAKTIIDVGANEGLFIKASQLIFPNAKIYAFEPQEKFYHFIKKKKNVTAFNFGLWNKEDKAVFYINPQNTGASSFLAPKHDYNKYIGKTNALVKKELQRKRFDSLNLPIIPPCCLKIDVEGAEGKVLEGFGDRLKEIDVLQIEWFFRDFHEGQMRLGEIIPLLEKYGFIGFLQVELGYLDNYPSACDLIFFKKKMPFKQSP